MDLLYDKIMKGKLSIPSFVSPYAKDLLKKILVTDPLKRYNINKIKNHRWFNMNNITINSGINISNSCIPVYTLVKSDRCTYIK